jgi:hypothetical protein
VIGQVVPTLISGITAPLFRCHFGSASLRSDVFAALGEYVTIGNGRELRTALEEV